LFGLLLFIVGKSLKNCIKNERNFTMHTPNPVILREYDIRGTYGKTLFETDATWLGERFGSFLFASGGRKIVLCRDGRESSPAIQKALSKALINCGLEVLDIGVGPTPMSYFAGYELNADATLMITGSHNPKDDNGIKITINNKPFFGEQIQHLLQQAPLENTGGCYTERLDIFDAYVKRVLKIHQFKRPLRIAWDAGNGVAGPAVEAFCKELPEHFHVPLFTQIDGTFPNHHPDPSVPKNLKSLIQAVEENACDIGFAFDGDADRIGVVDANGRIIAGDELVAILAKAILQEVKGGTIIADVKCSNHTFQAITHAGGKAVMECTGHSWIKQAMAKESAIFAGEMSGHMFFKHNYYGFDDGLYAAVFLLNYVQTLPENFSNFVAKLPKTYSTPEIRLECSEEEKFKIIDDLKSKLNQAGKIFNDLDGVRVVESKGWWLVRASNTQNALIVRAEGDTENDLQVILNELKSFGIQI